MSEIAQVKLLCDHRLLVMNEPGVQSAKRAKLEKEIALIPIPILQKVKRDAEKLWETKYAKLVKALPAIEELGDLPPVYEGPADEEKTYLNPQGDLTITQRVPQETEIVIDPAGDLGDSLE